VLTPVTQFDKVPRSILKLERKLRKEMEDDTPKYLRNRAKWERYMAQKRSKTRRRSGQEESDEDTAWRKLDDYPGQRANLDMDRFFNHYFLTDGKLDISKTPNPLRLDNITVENGKEVIRRTKALKGLHFCHTPQTAGSVLCVGVDQASVRDLTYKIRDEARAAAERNFIRHQEELWKEDMQAHNILAGQLCQQKAEDFADSEPMWKLRDCSGLFILRSEQIRAQYPRHLRNTLRISAKLVRTNKGLALVARFDFGVCSGTMFLAESIQTLQGLAEGDSHDMDAESDAETSANTSRKRKAPPSGRHAARKRKKPFRSDTDGQEPSLTLLVSFRGRKNLDGDSEIFHLPRNGKIDFYDDYHSRLKGNVDLPGIGHVSFEGWKTQRGKRNVYEPRSWDEFSETAFHAEKKKNEQQRQKHIHRRPAEGDGGTERRNKDKRRHGEKARLGTKERPYTIQ
jgi:thiamine phosphate synthase YjbQ (UPF0047 family)